jgi:predicted phage terminase large subunit-like protein
MKGLQKVDKRALEAARGLYLKYEGKQHDRIVTEMRAMGFPFYRSLLYTNKSDVGISPGWPERFGWIEMLTAEQQRCLRKKNAGRHYFEHWLRTEFPEWRWSWDYQRYIYRHLDRVTKKRSKRLMVFMPPRHGKSEMVTVRYTAWRLMHEPGLNVILGSYNQRLADRFSRKVKRVVQHGERRRETERYTKSSPPYEGGVAVPTSFVGTDGVVLSSNGAHQPTHDSAKNHPADEASAPLLRKEGSFKRLNSASEWETSGGGVVRSVGVGAGIAGFGAGLVVIDDPVRNRADAESQTYRDRVWEWFSDDIYTRLEPEGSIILIQTRWHEDDLAGRLLKEMEDGGEQWDVVCLPALAEGNWEPPTAVQSSPHYEGGVAGRSSFDRADGVVLSRTNTSARESAQPKNHPVAEAATPLLRKEGSLLGADPLGRKPGEALCPQRYGVETLERIRRKLGSYSFSALYQQRPSPAEGGTFRREWFKKIIDRAPEGLRWKRGYDLAISTKTTADYTASFRCAKDAEGNLYIVDGFRRRIEYPEQRRYIIERMRDEPNTEHGIESALHGKALVQDIRRDGIALTKPIRSIFVDKDKLSRALPWLAYAEQGKLFLVRGPWIDEFVEEVAAFPTGRHDDQIDAVSIAVRMLAGSGGRAWAF